MREVLIALGLAPRGGNYESIWRRIAELQLDASHLPRSKGIRTCSDERIVEAVKASRSFAQVLVRLGIRQGGGAQARLKRRVQRLGLDTSHFSGQAWRKGSHIPVTPALPLEKVLVIGRFTPTNKLKQRLIEAGLKERRCEICRGENWNGQPIPLELDHINGRRDNNRLINLRLLCPNCHAQTSTYRGRNIGANEGLF